MQDRIVSALFFIFALIVMRESVFLSLGEVRNPGPGLVPFVLGLSIAALSILCFLLPDREAEGWFRWDCWEGEKTIFSIFGGFILYLLLLQVLGFFIDTFLLLVYLMKLAGEKGYKRNLAVSGLTVITLYVVFYKLLKIPFPLGMLRM
ncbi:MAG: tripartite tricarboxylate transporter TctB family protein [Candidatus Binatia bacterium]